MKNKVLIYVLRHQHYHTEVLVFNHRLYPEVSPQVPAGTIKLNEDPLDAAIRELQEESGLLLSKEKALYLGAFEHLREDINESQLRHCFLFVENIEINSWSHTVSAGSIDKDYIFDYFWLEVSQAKAHLKGKMGLYLPIIKL